MKIFVSKATKNAIARSVRRSEMELAKPIKEAVNEIVFDKKIDRPTLIKALEEAASDIEGVLDSLREDERRAQGRR